MSNKASIEKSEEKSPIDEHDINIMFETFAECDYKPEFVEEIAKEFYIKYQNDLLSLKKWRENTQPVYLETEIHVEYCKGGLKDGNIMIYRQTTNEKKYGPMIEIFHGNLVVFGMYNDDFKSGETWYFDRYDGHLVTHVMYEQLDEQHQVEISMDGKKSVIFGGQWTGDGWTE